MKVRALRSAAWSCFIASTLSVCLAADVFDDTTQPSSQPTTSKLPNAPSGDFEVVEWVILVADPAEPRFNAATLTKSTLPGFVDTRRPAEAATQSSVPSPVGIIRFVGASPDAKVDVKLDTPNGRMLASWPKARLRSGSLQWRDLTLSPAPTTGPAKLAPIAPDQWLAALRSDVPSNSGSEFAYLSSDDLGCERFLLYDIEFRAAVPLKLTGGRRADDSLQIANVGTAPLHNLTFYRPDGANWRTIDIGELAPARKLVPSSLPTTTITTVISSTASSTTPAPMPSSESAAAPSTPPSTAASSQPSTQSSTAPSLQPTTAPATQPFAEIDERDVQTIQLQPASTTQPSELVSPWRAQLIRAGLPPNDVDLDILLRTLAAQGLDAKHLTAIYRLDDSDLEKMLPLEVLPQPKKTTRVGLVVVRNIDPSVPFEIDDLITQLGDRDWHRREAATNALASIGITARSKLQSAVNNPDAEIALRAERLLAKLPTK